MSLSIGKTVNDTPTGAFASRAMSFGSLPSSGSLLTVLITCYNTFSGDSHGISSLTDNQGNTYTRAVEKLSADSGTWVQLYYCLSIGAPSGTFTLTVTAHAGFSLYLAWAAVEVVPAGGVTIALDQVAGAIGNSSSPSVSATTTQPSEYVACCCAAQANQASITDPANYTQRYSALSYSNEVAGNGDDRILTSVSSETPTWTLATSAQWAACIATFKATGGAGAGKLFLPPNLTLGAGGPFFPNPITKWRDPRIHEPFFLEELRHARRQHRHQPQLAPWSGADPARRHALLVA